MAIGGWNVTATGYESVARPDIVSCVSFAGRALLEQHATKSSGQIVVPVFSPSDNLISNYLIRMCRTVRAHGVKCLYFFVL